MAHYKTRDYNMVALINGATKAGVFRNYRKHNNKTACRGKKTMPAAVLAHAPHTDVVVDWERDNDLFRIYANMVYVDGKDSVEIKEIHLLDETLQVEAVINTSMFTAEEWESIEDAAIEEWDRMNDAP